MEMKEKFGTDKKAEIEGKWFPVDDGEVLIARVGNKEYQAALRQNIQRMQIALKKSVLSEEEAEKVIIGVLSRTILLGWRNFTDEGEEVPYSPEKAVEFMTNYRDFREFVVENAEEFNNFKLELDQAARKNSKDASSGASSTGQKNNSLESSNESKESLPIS